MDTNYLYSTHFTHLLSGCRFYSSTKPVFSKDMRAMLLRNCFWTGLSPWTVLWTITHCENLLHACPLWHFLSPSLLNFHSVTSPMTPPFHCAKSFLPYYILNTVRQEIAYSSLTYPPAEHQKFLPQDRIKWKFVHSFRTVSKWPYLRNTPPSHGYLIQHLAQLYRPETHYTWYDDITASAIPANYL